MKKKYELTMKELSRFADILEHADKRDRTSHTIELWRENGKWHYQAISREAVNQACDALSRAAGESR